MSDKTVIELTTPPGIGSYVSVLEAKPDPTGKLKYSVSLIIPKSRSAELEPIRKAVLEVATAKWGPQAKAVLDKSKYPAVRDGDIDRPEDKNYKGCYYLSLRADRKPGVIDAHKNEVFTDEDVYSGCLMRCRVAVYAYEQKGNKGVAFGLNHVQVLRKDPRLDGRKPAQDVFEEWKDEADPLA